MEQTQRTMMHPDENLLAAFAERTLAPAERDHVLAHLSDCSECRDAVFLAQQANSEPELQPGFPPGQPEPRAWRWHWVTLSAAVLLSAILIGAPVLIYRHPGNSANTSPQMAGPQRNPAPAPPATVPSTPSPTTHPNPNDAGALRSPVVTASKSEFHARPSNRPASASAGPPNPVATVSATAPAALPPISLGQGSRVAGSVTDPSGAAIPGATVSLRLSDATTRRAVTDPGGRFEIGPVPPGNYVAEFSAPGFQSSTRDIDVHAQDQAALSETLAHGSASETVSVSAAATQLQTENAQLQSTIDGKEVDPRPLSGRNVTPLALGPSKQPAQASAGAGGAMGTGVGGGLVRPVAGLSINHGSLQSCVGTVCTARVLPSGTQAVSVASDATTALLVDANGNLFSSSDAGAHWAGTKPQWHGKAVAVQLAAPPSGTIKQSTGGPVATGAIAGTFAASSIFALTNDQGQVWLSSDEGQTWHPK